MVSSASPAPFSRFPAVPGPRGHWLLGHLPELRHNSLTAFNHANNSHGDLSKLQMLGLGRLGSRFDLHVLSHPDDIAYVIETNSANYPNAGMLRSRYLTMFGPCILAAEGQDHKMRRKLEMPSFTRARLNGMADCITDQAGVTVNRWEKRLQSGDDTFDMVPELMDLTLRVAGKMLLGTDFGAQIETLEKGRDVAFPDVNLVWLHENTPVLKRLTSPRRRRFARAKGSIIRAMRDIVDERRARGAASDEPTDLLDVLMGATDADGVGWTDEEIAGEMHALVRAGQDTTTSSVVWAQYLLSRHPEAEARLVAELEEVLNGRTPTAADLPNLPYLRAVYDETLRMFPPIPTVARTALADDAIRGHFIPKNTCIVLVSWLTHRDPRWWPEPDAFRPERFLGAVKADRPKYTYFPFGGGSRFCMGAGLALLQGPLVLATLLQRYRMLVAPEREVTPRAWISVLPDGGLPMTIERR